MEKMEDLDAVIMTTYSISNINNLPKDVYLTNQKFFISSYIFKISNHKNDLYKKNFLYYLTL